VHHITQMPPRDIFHVIDLEGTGYMFGTIRKKQSGNTNILSIM